VNSLGDIDMGDVLQLSPGSMQVLQNHISYGVDENWNNINLEIPRKSEEIMQPMVMGHEHGDVFNQNLASLMPGPALSETRPSEMPDSLFENQSAFKPNSLAASAAEGLTITKALPYTSSIPRVATCAETNPYTIFQGAFKLNPQNPIGVQSAFKPNPRAASAAEGLAITKALAYTSSVPTFSVSTVATCAETKPPATFQGVSNLNTQNPIGVQSAFKPNPRAASAAEGLAITKALAYTSSVPTFSVSTVATCAETKPPATFQGVSNLNTQNPIGVQSAFKPNVFDASTTECVVTNALSCGSSHSELGLNSGSRISTEASGSAACTTSTPRGDALNSSIQPYLLSMVTLKIRQNQANSNHDSANKRQKGPQPREKFAWSLIKLDLFSKKERLGKNCNGVGKQRLNNDKMAAVRYMTFQMFPVVPAGDKVKEEAAWKICVTHIDHNNRN
jgi:hypothetical protein